MPPQNPRGRSGQSPQGQPRSPSWGPPPRAQGYQYSPDEYQRQYRPSGRNRPDLRRPPPGPPGTQRRRRPGRIIGTVVVLLLLVVAGLAVYVDQSLNRVSALDDYPGRVANTAGTNWLIVGSDSRAGLTPDQASKLSTGDEAAAGGQRTDTIMLVHIPAFTSSDPATLVSLPRDSSVPIAGHGRLKLNAAFSLGGPTLLVQTVEQVTGVHLDHYAEIGFGGFAGLVDDVGGVQVCPTAPIDDPLAGLNIPAGCQQLDGPKALGYVRTRHTPRGDLDRVVHQREFVGALMKKAASPAVLFNPFRILPLAADAPGTLTVDNGDHVWHLARLGWTLRSLSSGGVVTTTVPIAGFGAVDDGSSGVLWDRTKAAELFSAIAEDRPVPATS